MREVGFVPVSSGKQFGSARIYCKWLTFLKCADNASTDKNRKRCILYSFSDMAWVQASPCLDYSALHSWSEPRAIRHTTAPGAVITIHQMEWIPNWFCFFYASKRECEKKKKKNLQIFLYLLSFVMTWQHLQLHTGPSGVGLLWPVRLQRKHIWWTITANS